MKKSLLFLLLPMLLALTACNPEKTDTTTEPTEATGGGSTPIPPKEFPYFIHLSDIHLNSFADTCTYGEDTGMDLWKLTQDRLEEALAADPAPQFVVYTGDLSAHYTCENPTCFIPKDKRGDHNQNLEVILTDLRKLVADNGIPFFYMPGNNDALSGDYFSFADAEQATPFSLVDDPANPYPALNASQPCGTAPCLSSEPHPTRGYYSAKATEGIRLIALNTIIWGRKYHEVDGVSQVDAGNEQLEWLESQLNEAATAGDKVIIAMHIPPGEDAYGVSHEKKEHWMWAHLPGEEDSWLNQFLGKVEAHSGTITGILYGHTHMDEVRRLYSTDGSHITEVAISAPGITPQHYNNAGFKQVWYDTDSKELLDFKTFYTTPQATEWGAESYLFSEVYGCGENTSIFECLSSQSLEAVNTAMDEVYTVKNGAAGYDTESGIEVKVGQ